MTDDQLRKFGYICDKCGATVPEDARSKCGCDLEIAKRGGGWMLVYKSICESCLTKIPEEEKKEWK